MGGGGERTEGRAAGEGADGVHGSRSTALAGRETRRPIGIEPSTTCIGWERCRARGTFLGLWRFTGQGGATLSPIIFAVIADQVSYGASFLFTAASAATVACLLIFFVPETRQPR